MMILARKKNIGSDFFQQTAGQKRRLVTPQRSDHAEAKRCGGSGMLSFYVTIASEKITLHCFTKRFLAGKKLFSYLCIRLDSAAVQTNDVNGRCHATTFSRFKFRQQMVISSSFLFLPIFHLPFSFNSTSFYLGWSLSTQQGLKWRLPRYPRLYWQHRSVSPKQQGNGINTVNFERFVQRQYTLAEKFFFQNRNVHSSNVWFIILIAFNSFGLL